MTLSCNSGIFLCSPWFFPKFGWYMVYSVLKKFLTHFPKKNLLWKGSNIFKKLNFSYISGKVYSEPKAYSEHC